eukprot:464124-Alexandrium_andersonii.AAC.1
MSDGPHACHTVELRQVPARNAHLRGNRPQLGHVACHNGTSPADLALRTTLCQKHRCSGWGRGMDVATCSAIKRALVLHAKPGSEMVRGFRCVFKTIGVLLSAA